VNIELKGINHMENNLKAAAIHRFSGWLGLIMTLLILIYTVSSHLGSITHVILLCILLLPVYLHFLIARGLVKRKNGLNIRPLPWLSLCFWDSPSGQF